MRNINILITATVAVLFFATAPESASADGWELRTTEEAVPGTWEIEQGNIAKAIEISKIRLPHVSQRQIVAVLNNLCIAYILTEDFAQAEDYCDQAVNRPNEQAVSYNNRGVLKALQGDVESSMHDFATAASAGCMGSCSDSSKSPRDMPRPIARRNLGKAEYLANQARIDSDETVAAHSN